MGSNKVRAIDAIAGRELEIVQALTNAPTVAFNGKNQPCPSCSTKHTSDRFRVVKTGERLDGYFCGRGYGCNKKGNNVGLIAHLNSIEYSDAEDLVLEYLGLKNLTGDDLRKFEENAKAVRAMQQKEQARHNEMVKHGYDAVARQANVLWRGWGQANPNHEYLLKKKVSAVGLRQQGNVLKVPVVNIRNEIRGIQSIYGSDKKFMKGQQKTGCFCFLGKRKKGRPILFVEGYATGATVHHITGLPVVVCFDAGNLYPVIKIFQAKLPNQELILFADNDEGKFLEMIKQSNTNPRIKPQNRGSDTILEMKAIGVTGIQPIIQGDEKKVSDWNDVCCLYGGKEVLRQIREQYKKATA